MPVRKLAYSALFAVIVSLPALAQVKIGVVTSSTGPTALVGIPQKNSIPLLPTKIGNLTVEYISLDDASEPATSVTIFKKLISEQKVDAIIGPTGSPNAIATLQFAASSETPMLAPVGTSGVVLPMTEQKKWVFKTTPNDDIIAKMLVEAMAKAGIRTVGFIGLSDPYGENWYKVFSVLAKGKGINLTANERFLRSDSSVAGQALKIMAAQPDAVLIAAPGGASVLPQVTLYDDGYKGKFYQTHGAALPDFLRVGGKKVEGTILVGGILLVLPQMPDSNPSKRVAQSYADTYKKLTGADPAIFGTNIYDAGLLLTQAIPIAAKAGAPGTIEFRRALRDALEQTHGIVGAQGIYNMTASDHSGLDETGQTLITVKDGKWSRTP